MAEDEFTKLFKYIGTRFDGLDEKFKHIDKRFDDVNSRLDGLTKLIMDYNQEMLMLAHKVDRMERWIHEIADKTGVKLSYD